MEEIKKYGFASEEHFVNWYLKNCYRIKELKCLRKSHYDPNVIVAEVIFQLL